MKRIISIKAYLFIVILITGCNEDILDYTDSNTYNTDNYFNTPERLREASTAIYVSFYYDAMFGFQWSEMFDALAAEAEPTLPAQANEAEMVPLWRYTYTNTNSVIDNYWRVLYKMILRSNLTIDKAQEYLDKNGDDPEHIVTYSQGEGYFLRGYAYFQLAFYWGRVPLRVTFDQGGNEDAPRAESIEDVWAVAEQSLKAAQQLLPETWDAENIGRATKGAATGFLGKLYLYNEKYAEADIEFSKLTSTYSLLPETQWMDNFGYTNENNQESLFEIQFSYFDGNYLNLTQNPESHTVPYTQSLLQLLYGFNDWANWKFPERRVLDFVYNDESGVSYVDPRAVLTFYGGEIGDSTWCDEYPDGPYTFDFETYNYWYRKYQNKESMEKSEYPKGENNIRLMRYADILLMSAECKLNTGDIPGCISLINQVRERIGAFAYNGSYNQTQAFELLKRERQLELMGEQHRFNDLKRWGILKEVMNVEMVASFGTPNVEDKHYLFPIPQREIDTNLGLGEVSNSWN